MGLILAKFL